MIIYFRHRCGSPAVCWVPDSNFTSSLLLFQCFATYWVATTTPRAFWACKALFTIINYLVEFSLKMNPFKNRVPSVKRGGNIMAWACFAASWPGQPAIIDGTMNSELYGQILKENVRTSV